MKLFLKTGIIFCTLFIVPFLCHAADQPYTNPLGMTFTPIEAGSFTMGSPADEPGRNSDEIQHKVTLTSDFHMQTTEVTQAQWEAVMGNNPSFFAACGTDCPVENVSWDDAKDFIRRLNRQGFGTYKLPTEAQWEYAARADSNTAFAGGVLPEKIKCEKVPALSDMGWYCHNGFRTTHAVGEKQPNDWGLYDMHGNVREWVDDLYGSYPEGPVEDPDGSESGFQRVIRGGSYDDFAYYCRSAMRLRLPPEISDDDLGFRLILADPGDTPCTYNISSTDEGYSDATRTLSLSDSEKTIDLSVAVSDQQSVCSYRKSEWGTWVITPDVDWMALSPDIKTGGGSVTIVVEENLEETSRSARVMIAGKEITINQDGYEPCTFGINPGEAEVSPTGETITVTINASSRDCAWTASKPDELAWVLFSPPNARGTGDGTIDVLVNQNLEGNAREGSVTIAGETFILRQTDIGSCNFQVSPSRRDFTATGTSSPVTITAAPGCKWTATTENRDWIRLFPTSGTGNDTVIINISPNQGGDRQGKVTIAGKTYTITQEAPPASGLTKTQVSQLYVAIFNRASEGSGNTFWQESEDMITAANEMLATPDAREYFGNNLDADQDFIGHIYLNTLGKTIENDPEGIGFWVDQLAAGASRGEVVAGLVAEIESSAPNGDDFDPDDAATIASYNRFINRVTVSDYMADTVLNPPENYARSTAFDQGLVVTDEVETLTDAKNTVDILAEDDPAVPVDPPEPPEESITNTLGMTFVLIAPDSFFMGSPEDEPGRDSDETLRLMPLEEPYYIQTTEVTQAQWRAVMGENPSYFQDCGDTCPVENVSWNDVQAFIAVLNQQGEGTYELPREAQWEYAARAGSDTAFANGNITDTFCADPNLDVTGWYCGNSDSIPNPVAGKQPNAWELYDMHGNVKEWVREWYDQEGFIYVIRGGGYHSYARACRSAARAGRWTDQRSRDIGFRLIMTPDN